MNNTEDNLLNNEGQNQFFTEEPEENEINLTQEATQPEVKEVILKSTGQEPVITYRSK